MTMSAIRKQLQNMVFDLIAADEYGKAFKWYEKSSVIAADNLIFAVQLITFAMILTDIPILIS